jgi:hypothetical protein
MRLALACGHPDWRRMLREELTSEDVTWWQAFERVQGPIGEARFDDLIRYLSIVTRPNIRLRPDELEAIQPTWWRDEPEPEIVEDVDESAAKRVEIGARLRAVFGVNPETGT